MVRTTGWCRDNNLLLNTTKTKEIVVDFRKKKTDIKPLYINGVGVGLPLPGSSHHKDLSWGVNRGELTKKAQQRLHFL